MPEGGTPPPSNNPTQQPAGGSVPPPVYKPFATPRRAEAGSVGGPPKPRPKPPVPPLPPPKPVALTPLSKNKSTISAFAPASAQGFGGHSKASADKPAYRTDRPQSAGGRPATPVTPAPKAGATPPPPAKPSTPSMDDVVIRTMKDDLAAPQGEPRLNGRAAPAVRDMPSARKTPPPGRQPARRAGLPPAPQARETAGPGTTRTLPLPPKNAHAGQKVVMAPRSARRKGGWLRFLLVLVLLGLLGGGGYAAWWYVTTHSDVLPNFMAEEEELVAEPGQVVPADTDLVIQYVLSSTNDRSLIQTAWSQASGPSVTSLLQGDPRLVLDDPQVSQLLYVVLPDDPRPYVVMPKTTAITQLLTDNGVPVTEHEGWYVAHSVTPDPYILKLQAGSLHSAGTADRLRATDASAPIRLLAGPGLLLQLRENVLGSGFANGQTQELNLAGQFVAGSDGLEFTGTADLLDPRPTAPANQQLLSLVPEDADFVRLGGSLADNIEPWAIATGLLDVTALERAATRALLEQLTTPYAFFVEQTSTTDRDYGIVITIPPDLSAPLALGDPALEQGLAALMPLVTGRKSAAPIAFSDGVYGQVPLRYANLTGTSHAIDYAVVDGFLLIATSKDAMFKLLDTAAGDTPSWTEAGSNRELLDLWGALPSGHDIAFGALTLPILEQLLPVQTTGAPLPFAIALQAASDGLQTLATGVLQLGQSAAPQVSASPTPSPLFFTE